MRYLPLATLTLLLLCSAEVSAQSGRATVSGFVAFEDVAYIEKQPTAKVELFVPSDKTHPVVTARTDEHGGYEFQTAGLGEFILRITATGYTPYETTLYVPSDFQARIGTLLKKPATTAPATKKK